MFLLFPIVCRVNILLVWVSAYDPFHSDADPGPGSTLEKNGSGFLKHFFLFPLIFLLKLSEPLRNLKIFVHLLFVNNFNLCFESKIFVLVHILPLGSGSVDPHIFADLDPESQNLADPTDPAHWSSKGLKSNVVNWSCKWTVTWNNKNGPFNVPHYLYNYWETASVVPR